AGTLARVLPRARPHPEEFRRGRERRGIVEPPPGPSQGLEHLGLLEDPVGMEILELLEPEHDPGVVVNTSAGERELELDAHAGHHLIDVVSIDANRPPPPRSRSVLHPLAVHPTAEIPQDEDWE